MAKQNIPEQPTQLTAQYSTLLGVDFQSDPTEVARYRSPDMVNMISDLGGSPIKRYGYRVFGGFNNTDYSVKGFTVVAGETYAVKTRTVDDRTYCYAVRIYTDENGNPAEDEPIPLADITDFGDIVRIFSLNGYIYMQCKHAWLKYDPAHPEKFYFAGLVFRKDNDLEEYVGKAGVNMIQNPMVDARVHPAVTTASLIKAFTPNDGDVEQTVPDGEESVTRTGVFISAETVPVIATLLKPNGNEMISLPEGTDVTGATQGVNLLQPWRTVEYCVQTDTADTKVFYFPNNEIASADTVRVEILDSKTYTWKAVPVSHIARDTDRLLSVVCKKPSQFKSYSNEIAKDLAVATGTRGFCFIQGTVEGVQVDYRPYKKVEVNNEPHLRFRVADTIEVPAGVPNVRVTYAAINRTEYRPLTTEEKEMFTYLTSQWTGAVVNAETAFMGYSNETRDEVIGASVTEIYDGRLFAAKDGTVYYTRTGNPLMLDDNFYFTVDSDVAAFAKTSNALTIIPDDNGNGHIYLAQGEYNEAVGMPVYSIRASNASVGGITGGTGNSNLGVLNDEPVFLSTSGIYAMTTNFQSEKYAISRSGKIDRRLAKEPALRDAVGTVFNNYLWLAVGTHMYILDGRHKEKQRNGDNSYECYYFEDMPVIRKMHIVENRLYFEGADGTMYIWNDDLEGKYRYMDGITWNSTTEQWENGRPVKARWSSMVDGDNAPQYYKILQKKGTMVTIAPPMQTSCQVTIIKDGNERIYIGRFDGSTFALSNVALDGFTKKKIKKYKRLQFIVENNEAEPFSIISVIKTYIMGNYAKR
jgi:hypothetical protein